MLKLLGPVEERLYEEAQILEQKKAARQDLLSEASQHAPNVDDESRRICKSSVYFQGAQHDFLTRQQTFELAKQRRMEVRAQHADAECSFKPKISETSRQMVSGNLDFVGETLEDRVHRLAVKDVERRDQLRGALEQLHYRDCTFKPEVNGVSQLLASRLDDASSTDSGADGSQVHERLYRSALSKSRPCDDFNREEYSFQPQIDPRSAKRFAHIKPHYSSNGCGIMENIRLELERKQELLLERRQELEEQQFASCTFAPETGKSYEEPQRPVIVSGLGRFFELRSLAQRQRLEKEEREVKLFRPEMFTTRCGGVTIPEPFDLSCGQRDDTSEVRRAWEQVEPPDGCTFKPQTNESANREIIKQMMSSPLVC